MNRDSSLGTLPVESMNLSSFGNITVAKKLQILEPLLEKERHPRIWPCDSRSPSHPNCLARSPASDGVDDSPLIPYCVVLVNDEQPFAEELKNAYALLSAACLTKR